MLTKKLLDITYMPIGKVQCLKLTKNEKNLFGNFIFCNKFNNN